MSSISPLGRASEIATWAARRGDALTTQISGRLRIDSGRCSSEPIRAFMVSVSLLLVLEVDPAWVDPLSGVLFEAGAVGLEERSVGDRVELWAYPPDEQALARWEGAARSAFARLEAEWPGYARPAHVEVRALDPSTWQHEWMRHLKPELLGDSFVIQPQAQHTPAPPGRQVITFEPSLCFGVGSHPTTQLSARSVERLCRERPGLRVLDVGTGTGVLAMVALLSGATSVTAVDFDPAAVAAALRNLQLNRLQQRCRVTDQPLAEIGERFDLVVANLDAPTLLRQSEHLARATAGAGSLVVSGLLLERVDEVRHALERHGLVLRRFHTLEDWCALELAREP